MNKKQLVVAWIMAIAICYILLSAPKVYYRRDYTRYIKANNPLSYADEVSTPDWNVAAQNSIPVLLIGGLLIYTLRTRKK